MTIARAVWSYIEQGDHRFMRRMQRWRAPWAIRAWMLWATRLGDGWLWYAVGMALLFGGERHLRAFACGGTAALAAILVFKGLKEISKRQRPCEIEPHCWARVTSRDEFSFPSGHSMTACAIAVCLGHFCPGWEAPLLLVTASIAASRIVLGMHFLTDVMVGCVIGVGLGYGSVCLFT
jgi:undecaprenyl-diphosphatase